MSTLCCQSKCAQKTFFNKAIILLDIECHFLYGQNRRIQMNIRHDILPRFFDVLFHFFDDLSRDRKHLVRDRYVYARDRKAKMRGSNGCSTGQKAPTGQKSRDGKGGTERRSIDSKYHISLNLRLERTCKE